MSETSTEPEAGPDPVRQESAPSDQTAGPGVRAESTGASSRAGSTGDTGGDTDGGVGSDPSSAADAVGATTDDGPAEADASGTGSHEEVTAEAVSTTSDAGEGRAPAGDDPDGSADGDAENGEALLVQEGEIAGDYLEQLLDILDYDGDIDLDVEGARAIVAIVGDKDLDPLVGVRGVTLDALQELTRLTVAQQTGVRTRLMLDVGGYRAGRRIELSDLATANVSRVIESGETIRMSPMNAFERKIVHDVVTASDGVRSESEGEDPDRRVAILPDR